jgi:long-chain-fatty-acid--CoA ligase ACSBG
MTLQLTWTAAMTQESVKYQFAANTVVTYLPLSHIAGMMVDIYVPLITATTVYFAEPDAMRVCQCMLGFVPFYVCMKLT